MARHKHRAQDFTRIRVLTFPLLIGIMLRKSNKSIQLVLNEMVSLFPSHTSVTGSAYSKARQKIRHTAFIELNEKVVVDLTYADTYQTYKGHRLLAVDGSKILLPDTPETREEFGTIPYRNEQVQGEHVWARASVLYDVLNNVAVTAIFSPNATSEIDLAQEHLTHSAVGDLIIFDRGYCAYTTMVAVTVRKANFLIRCHRRSFKVARDLFTGTGTDSITVTLAAPAKSQSDLPAKLTVRFIRVVLPTGEIEVLATSLLDEKRYPTAGFQELYWQRWGVETFYGMIKTRLSLENFSGYSVESIRQDFFVTIFLSGLESMMTADVDKTLRRKATQHKQQVNKAVSFNAIKNRTFDIILSDQAPEKIVEELTTLFLTNPTLYRPDKTPERRHSSSRQILNFFKRKRKVVF